MHIYPGANKLIPKFEFPPVFDEIGLYIIEKEIARIRELPLPIDWAKKNFKLTSAYAHPGDFNPYPWQAEIINSILFYEVIILCGATQTFKSLAAEIMIAYLVDNMPMNAILCYAKKETIQDVFADRIKPMIKENPAIARYWSGDDKDLTLKKIRLSNMFMRVASAEVPSDIATWSSGIIYASEVSKYRRRRGWDPIEALKRRQDAYKKLGMHRAIFESSPLFESDCLDMEMKRPDVLVLEPYVPCPHCGEYQIIVDSQIREIPNRKNEKDHNPQRIIFEKAAKYECRACKRPISEELRLKMAEKVVWAANTEIIAKNGEITGREKRTAVAFKWNRLVDWSFTFHECLARKFAAMQKGIESHQVYVNEDMAEFWKTRTRQLSDDYLLTRRINYRGYATGDIPNEVLILLLGADTQDNGFYFIVNGYGRNMTKYLIRADFIEAPRDMTGGKDPRQLAFERFVAGVWARPYIRRDGRKMDIYFGFIDVKGHRGDDVRYICNHVPQIRLYAGLSRIDLKKPIIDPSTTGDHYNGQTQLLSEEFSRILESDRYFLPQDINDEYLAQVRNEWIERQPDRWGNTRRVWVKKDPNHFRSAENYCLAAIKINDLESLLNDDDAISTLETNPETALPGPDSLDENTEDDSEYFNKRRWK